MLSAPELVTKLTLIAPSKPRAAWLCLCLAWACSSTTPEIPESAGGSAGIASAPPSSGGASTVGGSASGGTSAPTFGGASLGGASLGGASLGGGGAGAAGSFAGGAAGAAAGTGSGGTISSGGVAGAASGGQPASRGGAPSAGATGTASGGSASGSPPTVWIAGDSTVANGNTPCPTGWGGPFRTAFKDGVKVVNSAVGGRSVRTWLYNVTTQMDGAGECVLQTDGSGKPTLQARWQDMLKNMKQGDYLFIQFGINDGSPTCDRHVGIAAFKESYGMMAMAAKERGTQPILLTPTSMVACNGSTARPTRGEFVTATLDVGKQLGVPVIDLHALTIALYTSRGFCPIPGGDVSASTTGPVGDFFCDDHTHFSQAGASAVAELVAQALRDQKIALSSYLK